jgi:hypothetical protein
VNVMDRIFAKGEVPTKATGERHYSMYRYSSFSSQANGCPYPEPATWLRRCAGPRGDRQVGATATRLQNAPGARTYSSSVQSTKARHSLLAACLTGGQPNFSPYW